MGLRESIKALSHQASPREKFALLIAIILIFISFIFDIQDANVYENHKHWIITVVGAGFLWGIFPATVRCASDAKLVWVVCGASVFLLISTLCTFALSYFWASRYGLLPLGAERLLTIPAVGTALWGTAMGWYVHFQASSKNNRTANSFNLLMQTRTCGEFLKRANAVISSYPQGTVIPNEDVDLFLPEALAEAKRKFAEALSSSKGVGEARLLLKKTNAAASLKYLLNYYEFMSVGISKRDLDEELLYETIAVTVTSMYERSLSPIARIREKQPLAFQHLERLVARWKIKLHEDEQALKR